MSSPASEFEEQLELFRTEAQSAIQFFYAWDAIRAVAKKDKAVFRLLNQAPLFWNTALGALQTAALVALGRVFDPDTKNYSVTRLLTLAHANLQIFSKAALAARKEALSASASNWIADYLKTAYVPKSSDFRRLKRYVSTKRRVYEDKYRPLRHKVFAHRGAKSGEEVSILFARTNLRELRQLLVFLGRLYEALWQLYFNGRKPALRPARSSVQRMLEVQSPSSKGNKLQERLVFEARTFLARHGKDA